MSEETVIPAEEMLGESDWDDQDLLTLDEAATRLDAEIAACRQRLDDLRNTSHPPADDIGRTQRRLDALLSCRDAVAHGPTALAKP
ncbi:hypothetical protein CJ179_01525 [Rhodococcus sp. ACS1]|uniref:Uncharacterized protein n=1 Tax=Rhodococcus jostii TaxID=132919 RepID=A0A1H4ILB5_RHOJO|nr:MULTISPECIES: hypothetical protein [Rhodococcus]PBC52106.1 hypothetical protein CJ179_01525 [Rhodococcus sp. ACS1]SEB34713.1 hypothetical protein SAMN04490220_0181 [Rhodococcus jostii]